MNFETLQLDSPAIPELCREKYRQLLGAWPAPGEMDDRAAAWAMAWLMATQEQNQGDGWIEWGGGECPVAPQTLVHVQFRSGNTSEYEAADPAYMYSWGHDEDIWRSDIVAYRVVKEPRHG